MLYVAGETISLNDWDGHVSYVLFLSGCNLRCQYCHNPEMMIQDNRTGKSVESVIDHISNSKLIDSVIFTGGEPTEQYYYLNSLMYGIHHNLGLPIKLDTNGTKSFVVEKVLGYLTKVSLDLKAAPTLFDSRDFNDYIEPGLYGMVTGVYNDSIVVEINRTMKLVGESNVMLEGRTTVVPGLVYEPEDIETIAKWAAPYVDEYTLQAFRNDTVYNKALRFVPTPTREHMEMLADVVREYIPNVNIRPHLP